MGMVFNASVLIRAVDYASSVLRNVGMAADAAHNKVRGLNSANIGQAQGVVLKNMVQQLNTATSSLHAFKGASSNMHAMYAFGQMERAINQTRQELSLLGFGKTKAEIEALEGQLHSFVGQRMDNLRDQIKLTEKAIEEMKSSMHAEQYAEDIKKAEAALKEYKRELADTDPVKKMAEVNGYAVQRVFGKDVIVKPITKQLDLAKAKLYGFFNRDLAFVANWTYNTIDKAAKRIVGSTSTIAEQRQKINQLATAYQTLGTTINTMVTPYVLIATAAFGMLGAKYEEAYSKFQSQTLTPDIQMPEYKDLIVDVHVETGAAYVETGKLFSYLKNQLGETEKTIAATATEAITLAKPWDQANEKVAESIRKITDETKLKKPQVLDMFALSLKKNQGDIEKATKDIQDYLTIYKKLSGGGKVSNTEVLVSAKSTFLKEALEQDKQFQNLTQKAGELQEKLKNAKTPKEELAIREKLKNVTAEMSKIQGDAAKKAEEYAQQQLKLFNELNKTDGSKAYETVKNAGGPIAELLKAIRGFGAALLELFKALAPTLTAIANGLTAAAKAATNFLRAHPGMAQFIAYSLAGAAAVTVLVGALAPVAWLLLRSRGLFQALGQSITVAANGGKAVLDPMVTALTKRFTLFRNAIIGLPRVLTALFPALLTMFRALPGAIASFAIQFVKVNPLLSAFSLLAMVAIDNWDRVGPILTKMWNDVKFAFQPLFDALKEANSTIWPQLKDILHQISQVAGDGLVAALEALAPVIHEIAGAINYLLSSGWGKWILALLLGGLVLDKTVGSIMFLGKSMGALGKIAAPFKWFGAFVRGEKEIKNLGGAFTKLANLAKRIVFKIPGITGLAKIGQGIAWVATRFRSIMPVAGRTFSFIGRVIWGNIAPIGQLIVWVGRLGARFTWLGVKALWMGARMALAWIIGLGPVAWIIAGVTAIIAGAIVAWNTNFMGFRDKVKAVWNTIKTSAITAWNGIKSTINSVMEWLGAFPDKALQWGQNLIGMFTQGIRNKIGELKAVASEAAAAVKSFLGFSSPTETGPASNSDKWAPNFMNMFVDGMESHIPMIQSTAKRMAAMLKPDTDYSVSAHVNGNVSSEEERKSAQLKPMRSANSTNDSATPTVILQFQPGSIVVQGGGTSEENGRELMAAMDQWAKQNLPRIMSAIQRQQKTNRATYRPGLSQ
jgi:hypothetical protein